MNFAIDSGHRLLSKTDSRLNKTLSWTYDKAGNLNTKTDYQRDVTTYQYDASNRLVAETNPAYVQVSYHYDGAGRLLDRVLSNGAKTQYRYDAGGRLLQLTNTTVTGQVVNDTTYTRDRVGNSLSHTEAAAGQPLVGTTTYTYDPNYRLLRADYPGTANDALYSYDRVGNRLTDTVGSLSANSGTRYYTVNAGNRLTDIRTGSATGPVYESYQYDANGSLTQISGNRNLSLSWDANNRASAISGRTYRYDPADYRIGKGGTGATLNYYLDGEHLDAVYDGGITVQSQHLRGSIIDEVVYSYQRDNTNKLVAAASHHDALQSVLGESNHQGAIQYRQSYTAFGTATNTSQPQRYTGREMDSESGLYYYRARYYDPTTGRFISEDPLGFQAG